MGDTVDEKFFCKSWEKNSEDIKFYFLKQFQGNWENLGGYLGSEVGRPGAKLTQRRSPVIVVPSPGGSQEYCYWNNQSWSKKGVNFFSHFFPIFVCLLLFLVLMGVKIIDHKEEVDNNKACQGTSDYLLIKGDLNNDQKKKKTNSTDGHPYQDWEEFLGLVFPAGGENQWGNLQAAILTSCNMMMMNPVFVVMGKQAITPFHFFDYSNLHHHWITFITR